MADQSYVRKRGLLGSFEISAGKRKVAGGCTLCRQGAKMVLFVTGMCSVGCYYCPLSEERSGRDGVWANELLVAEPEGELLEQDELDAIIAEARIMDALGTGITGGDPFLVPDRTEQVITHLKQTLGPDHHIHLYTAGATCADQECRSMEAIIRRLARAGLDEIRFHPLPGSWEHFQNSRFPALIQLASDLGLEAGVEVPGIPGHEEALLSMTRALQKMGSFININELEFSPTNSVAMKEMGHEVDGMDTARVKGSREIALRVSRAIRAGDEEDRMNGDGSSFNMHFCSSAYKDGIQLRRRMKRRARNVKQRFEYLTTDGTLLLGIIEPSISAPREILETVATELKTEFDVPSHLMNLDNHQAGSRSRLLVAPWILYEIGVEIASRHDVIVMVTERYPTSDGLEVERVFFKRPDQAS